MATIITKNSSTASAVPAAGSLVQGELAINVTDKKLYTKDSGGTVQKLVGSLGNQEANAVAITGGTESGVAITGGTINNTPIGATTASTITGTVVTATTGFSGPLTGAVTGNTTGTHTGAVVGNVTGDLTGNVTASSGSSSFNNVTINGTLDMNAGTTGTVTGLAAPTNSSDAATKAYVDTAVANVVASAPAALDTLNELATALGNDSNFATSVATSIGTKVSKAGDTMTGNLAMGSNKVTGLGTPTAGTDATTKTYVDSADALKLNLSGGTLTGNLDVGVNKVTSSATPSTGNDLTNKTYVDSILGSATSAAASASAAQTSATNAANSASAAASSATDAANSASSAAASYDSFDDRYLGAKASAPTLDNDGNALLTGALYWNSTSNDLWVWSGSAWTQATLTAGSFATLAGTETLTNKTISTVNQTALQYATSNLPAIKPSLNLDFANTKQLDPRITFTRASTATYYDGKTTAMAEQNLLLNSQEFNNAYWFPTNSTVTANSTTAPDGTLTADTLADDATNGTHTLSLTTNGVSGSTYVFSVFAKANTRSILWMNAFDTAHRVAWFDLSAGTVGTVQAGVTASIVSVGNGWYRCTTIRTASAATFYPLIGVSNADNVQSYIGNGSSIFIWGAQLEQRSAASAYTATTSAPITNYIPVLQTAASGVARFDNNPTTGESLGLLIEEQRTNLLTYSDDFADANWSKTASSITSNTVVAPNGTLTADKLVENTANAQHLIGGSASASAATAYVASIYVKAAERTKGRLRLGTNIGFVTEAIFDLSAGTVTGTGSSISAIGNGWFRVGVTGTTQASTTSATVQVYTRDAAGNETYTGDGYSGIYIWGAQLEAGAFATSYIPTVASQVTRAADAASMTGTNFSSWYNAAEGTIYGEYTGVANISGGTRRLVEIGIAAAISDRFVVGYSQTNNTRFLVAAGGATQADVSASATQGSVVKFVGAYATNNFQQATNATLGTADTSGNVPLGINSMAIGADFGPTANTVLNGTIRKIAYYPLRVTNAQLQALTS